MRFDLSVGLLVHVTVCDMVATAFDPVCDALYCKIMCANEL